MTAGTGRPFTEAYPNVALARLGTRITGASDEFFAPAARIIDEAEPVFIVGKYDDHGKWMDGWETRRRRSLEPDHDHLELDLGSPVVVKGVNVSTRHFNGNQPEAMLLEASNQQGKWETLVERSRLEPDSDNWFEVTNSGPWTQVRLSIYPDGGVARLRVHGHFTCDLQDGERADLALVTNGARIVGCSDAHFGAPTNMLLPGKGRDMGDGWETARRRGPGNDWAVVELGCPGKIEQVLVDTSYFKGNYPASCELRATMVDSPTSDTQLIRQAGSWPVLVGNSKLGPDVEHVFKAMADNTASHVMLSIHPDGGVSRLRITGTARK